MKQLENADNEIRNDDILFAKSTMAAIIKKALKERDLNQINAAELLGTHQTQLSRLANSKGVETMTIDLLMCWLVKLGCNIAISIKAPSERQERHRGCFQIKVG